MSEENSRLFRMKGLKWVVSRDRKHCLIRYFLRHPFRYAFSYLRSLCSPAPFFQDDDFFYYGVNSLEKFTQILSDPKTILALGVSYCQKPRSCPSLRFSESCDSNHPECGECSIGRMKKMANDRTAFFIISTINSVGTTMFRLIDQFPDKNIVFCITACDMSLRMFSDLGNMIALKGIGLRLGGQVCPNMKAFMAAEDGHKRGVTRLDPHVEAKLFDLLAVLQ